MTVAGDIHQVSPAKLREIFGDEAMGCSPRAPDGTHLCRRPLVAYSNSASSGPIATPRLNAGR
ncbi:hypothetical protein [Pandoraea sp. NE5]|uniref:hypothetical protein n=1 Tax=Pandoraea sp. NE5 TaxID=2904129 RepID=UPI003965BC86